MTWTPSEGLRRAEPIVQTLLRDMATMGMHVTDPTLRWRMVQTIADGIDKALGERGAAVGNEWAPGPDAPPDEDAGYVESLIAAANGLHEENPLPAVSAAAPRARRSRGRPRGSGKKQRAARAAAKEPPGQETSG